MHLMKPIRLKLDNNISGDIVMSWFEKLMPKRIRVDKAKNKKVIPEGYWEKCPSCNTVLYRRYCSKSICLYELWLSYENICKR